MTEKIACPDSGANLLPQPIIFSDFDGTISRIDVTDQILEKFAAPGWRKLEQTWVKGEIGSRECLQQQMMLVRASAAEIRSLVSQIPIDPHFPGFYSFVRERKLPFYVLSDGFDYVVRQVLRRSGAEHELRNGRHLFASALRWKQGRMQVSFPHQSAQCPHGCATCKPAIIERLRKGRQVIFIGDGLSDRFAVECADLIFAKGKLLDYCREHGFACRAFETFGEIQDGLESVLPPVSVQDLALASAT